nr:ABC transporter permease [Acidobacteriota bacterium]
MEQVMRQAWAFVFRDYHLTRRYFSWVVVFTFYAVVNSATVVLIGVAAGDRRLTLTLLVGVMLWGLLSVVFQ